MAKENSFRYVSGNEGYFSYWTHGMGSIYRAVVLINSKAGSHFKKHLIREEIAQSLGPANDSDYSSSSIFYTGGKLFGGNPTEFSDLDKQLLRFFYKHLKAGYAEEKLAQAYLNHWDS
ncbi:DUF2927 domain-containing protein [Omnitrophica bacterium]|nr:DUF2927 domain-containing protein [Candidatus Omnitrophota bacterium]